ncbi:alkaline-phosphatase-like protein, partial [Chytriomyces sp. MP71]
MQFKSVLLLAAVAAAVDPSAPSVGQQNRFRALPRGSNLAISPVDGAEFIAGQHFDISIELHNENGKADASDLTFTINGKPASDLFGASAKPYVSNYNSTYYKDTQARDAGKSTKFNVARLSWRNLALPASGDYNLEVKTGSEKVAATWTVKGSSTRKAKNAILFIGDGMAPTMISAARYLAKYTKFGKFAKGDGFLNIEKFDAMGKIATNGIDAIITDSANSAAAYTSGQKGWVNTLSVYADTSSSDSLDDPKVETLAEIIRRNRPGMCIGVVTTASVLDATPAAMFGHTRSRGQGQVLVDQALNGFRYLVNNGTGNVWTPGAEPMPWGPAVKPD